MELGIFPRAQTVFSVWWYVKPQRSCIDCALSFQNNLNVISLARGDFKFSIGSLNNKFPYTVLESLKVLQLSLCLQIPNFNTAANMKEAPQSIMNQNWRKKISHSNNIEFLV